MTPEELHKHSQIINDTVSFIEEKTEQIWGRYEQLDNCYSEECNKEKRHLREEMDNYLDKLRKEEKMIDQYEEILHNKTGIK
jgi:DNA-binding transcriptional regulator GbsR (MarR family)